MVISIYSEGKELVIKVENNGEKLTASQEELLQKGRGLSNLDERLHNLYGINYSFVIKNKRQGGGVETVVRIPNH